MRIMFICGIIQRTIVCLLVCVTLAIIPAYAQWSGFVNNLSEDVDYLCPGNQSIIGVASDHNRGANDRQWEFLCGSGGDVAGILTTCNLEAPINEPTEEITYDCPGNAYIGGFQSTFDASTNDRTWRPYCCSRPRTALINCIESTIWENRVGETLNWTTPGLTVITGVETFFDFVVNDRRWRYHYCNIQVDCGDPGLPENSDRQGDRFLFTDTVQFTCNNGYYQSSGDNNLTCLNTGEWNGTLPNCTACTDIANCEQILCTNATDHTCFRCQSDNGTGYGQSAYRNLVVECEPLCSWLAFFCYPGNCMNGISSCNCSEGFVGDDCLEITEEPTVMNCQTTVGNSSQSASTPCLNETNLVFINFIPSRIDVTWEAMYLDPNPRPSPPAYVTGFDVGLASLYAEANLYRAANPNMVVSSSMHNCSNVAISSDAPQDGPLTCNAISTDLSPHPFLHGDYFMLDVYTLNGGYLDIFDLDTYTTTKHYYNGVFVMLSSRYQLDLVSPAHCLFLSTVSCTQPILDIGNGITESNLTMVSWGGWIDSPADVEIYSLDVYLLEETGGELREQVFPRINSSTHQDTGADSYSVNVPLPSDGPYSFVLQVSDKAGNLQYARRLLLFDTTSRLAINSDLPLRVTSAIAQTGYIWQDPSIPIITVTGRGHFYNTNLQTSDWLAPVADFAGATIDPAYDHPLSDGQYPRMGTTNALGVLSLLYEVVIDIEGGMSNDSLAVPTNFNNVVSDIALESVDFNITATDGESVRIWFKAIDFKSQEIYDSLVVHFDSSPPMLRDLWLEYNGESGLLLHGSSDLTTMVISFEAWDEHSGLWSLEWRIGTWYGGGDVGSGRAPLVNYTTESCIPEQCLCNSIGHCYATRHQTSPLPTDLLSLIGSHDTDYYITVVVTNWAYLQTQLTQQITIDTTPPLPGAVFEGDSSRDIDYQQDYLITAQWTGFFDRESEIQFYQYAFGTSCADEGMFTIPAHHNIGTTNGTTATWRAPDEGLYRVTVAAINSALRHSTPVCSDGIIIDNSHPVINDDLVIAGKKYQPDQEINYIVTDYSFNISWTASDNFGIYDYFVGVASSQSLTSTPDLIPLRSTTRQPFAALYSSNLTSGRQFYVVVKAEDHVLLSETSVFGPILLDTSPPMVNGTTSVNSNLDIIIVSWHVSMIRDPEQVQPLADYEYAIGRSRYGSEIREFVAVDVTSTPNCPDDHHCFTVNASLLQLLDHHSYYFPIRVTNLAGLSSMVPSEEYVHISGVPSIGFVFDVDLSRTFDVSSGRSLHMEDIDVAVMVDTIDAHWDCCISGVAYAVGLGSAPGLDDVVNFTATTAQGIYSFTNVPLVDGTTYYTTIVATNSFGPGVASSDGVLVLQTASRDVRRYALVLDGHNSDSGDVMSQASHTHAVARWHFPGTVTPFISHYRWALLAAINGSTENLEMVKDYENVGDTRQATAAGLSLVRNQLYISAVQACHLSDCLTPVYSTGFYVTTAPIPKSITATYNPLLAIIQASWEPFDELQLRYYEWSVSEELAGYNLLLPWKQVTGNVTTVTYMLSDSVSYSPAQRIVFSVRGVNEAGLHATVSTSINWIVNGEEIAQDSVLFDPPIVYDIQENDVRVAPGVSDWSELEHYAVNLRDVDYVGSSTVLYASWPSLRYQVYSWSVSENNSFQYCDSPYSIACGDTIANFVIVEGLNLTHGHTYYTCVQASIENIIIPNAASVPGVLTACSDGVIVDLAPPTTGCVQIVIPDYSEGLEFGSAAGDSGSDPLQDAVACANVGGFQASNSELLLKWDNFTGVDTTYHITSITNYEYAIGTVPGGSDVVDFTKIGIIDQLVLSNLQLQSGQDYYATVKAYNFVASMAQATSMAVTVDTSLPIVNGVWIGKQIDHSVTSRYNVTISWDPVLDPESGLASIEWALGSQPGWSDIVVWQQSTDGKHSSVIQALDGVSDGQLIFASILAINRAGLSQVKTSIAYVMDSSPPVEGLVLDGAYGEDSDYIISRTSYAAHWNGFADPHSDIMGCEWAIGSCHGCTDIQTFLSVGLMTESTREGLSLRDGVTYYATVRVCNMAGLCTTATSNGATVDGSPPIPGAVMDGIEGANIQFQASPYYIGAHWMGFHDSHSAIAYYQFYSGLQPNSSDVVSPFIVDASQTSLAINLPTPLNPNSTIFTTIVAYNGAGLRAVVTTDGVRIVAEAPTFVSSPFIDVYWAGALLNNTQYDNSLIRLVSNVTDNSNTVSHYAWAVYSSRRVTLPLPPFVSLIGHIALTELHLSDGGTYYAEVEACNAAGLCSKAQTVNYFVDSSPPIDGYFAVRTSSVEQVPGRVEIMTWRNSPIDENCRIRLYFAGFSDPHSGITHHYCSVGTSYSTSDLTRGFTLLEEQQANTQGTLFADVTLNRQVNINEILYISLWAENGVGLTSRVVQGSFSLSSINSLSGTLELRRTSTCSIDSCLHHCTCAARGDLCDAAPATCIEISTEDLPWEMHINVTDIAPQMLRPSMDGRLFTVSLNKLAAEWEPVTPNTVQWFEWSVAVRGEPAGTGLLDVTNEQIWFNAGTNLSAIFTVSPHYPLTTRLTYVFYVRAWYNNTAYAIFSSAGVTVDPIGPEIIEGFRTIEVASDAATGADIDHVSSQSTIDLNWQNVFQQMVPNYIIQYEIAIGGIPAGYDVLDFSVLGSVTEMTLSGLELLHGQSYYSTVVASSPTGLTAASISDGFVVDITPPIAGTVLDGYLYTDKVSQSNTDNYLVRWYEFVDPETSIDYYKIAVGDLNNPPTIDDYINVGLNLKYNISGLALATGSKHYAFVAAVNQVKMRSTPSAVSDGIIVDDSRPTVMGCTQRSVNLLSNPSFDGPNSSSAHDGVISNLVALGDWQVSLVEAKVLSINELIAVNGRFSLFMAGTISQAVNTTPNAEYRITFYVHRWRNDGDLVSGTITAPGLERRFEILKSVNTWTRISYMFKATSSSSTITISSSGNRHAFAIDNVVVDYCINSVPLDVSDWSEAININPSGYLSSGSTRLYVDWYITDEESGIAEYLWAIGTSQGGEQLMKYTSTGTQSWAVSPVLQLQHNMSVFVSVLAWNHAGLETLVQSMEHIVDLTPPVLVGSLRNTQSELDLHYQSAGNISVDWSDFIDYESSIDYCLWAIGSSPGRDNLQSFTVVDGTIRSSVNTVLMPTSLVFVTVTCVNHALLHTTVTSDGILVFREPPNHSSATLTVSSLPNSTQALYSMMDNFVPSASLTLSWTGFEDLNSSHLEYEYRITASDGDTQGWIGVGATLQLLLSNLSIATDQTHTVAVRATNPAGLTSQPVTENLTISMQVPVDTGTPINVTILPPNILLEWSNKFNSSVPLYYEVSVGTRMGSGSIVRWLESTDTFIQSTNPQVSSERDYFVTLTAISYAGLHTTVTQLVPGIPIV